MSTYTHSPRGPRLLPPYMTEKSQFNTKENHQFGMKELLQFDLTHLLTLQSQFRNFKMHLQLYPIETKAKDKVDMATRSVYDLSGINNWTKEDEEAKKEKEKGEIIEDKPKIDPFSFYDPSKFPVAISHSTNEVTDNAETRDRMTKELEKLMKDELERLVNKATENFTKWLDCPRCERTHSKCMTPAITTMLVELQMEMRQADPERVTQHMVDNWLKAFEKVAIAYQRESYDNCGACDKLVEVKRDVKMTWVWNYDRTELFCGVDKRAK